ncbi:MAG TPA: hypothetical protein DCG12_10925 [Planctomycetaceae bacterium]|nr:hypothetical protein [Planctomycetaceae bacterium]
MPVFSRIPAASDPISYTPRCSAQDAHDLSGNEMQKSAKGFIGAMLFLAPFGIAGLIAADAGRGKAADWIQIQSWQKVPATVESVGVIRSGGKKPNQGQTGRVAASYGYEYENKSYTGRRVALFEFSDKIDSTQEDNLECLQSILKKKHATHCYVNPAAPSDAILIPYPRRELFALIGFIAGLMGTVGVVGQITLIRNLRKARSADAEIALSPNTSWTWLPRWQQRGYLQQANADSDGLRAEIDVAWKLRTTMLFNGSDHRVAFRLPVFEGHKIKSTDVLNSLRTRGLTSKKQTIIQE